MKKYFELEDKYIEWIPKHKFLYICLIIFIGLLLGYIGNLILGGSVRQGLIMMFGYTFILLLTEFYTWGFE